MLKHRKERTSKNVLTHHEDYLTGGSLLSSDSKQSRLLHVMEVVVLTENTQFRKTQKSEFLLYL